MKQLFANLTSFVLAAACLALLCATPASLRAATIKVTNTADSGPGSLRAALASAGNGDTIDATGVSGTITLTSGQLSVPNSVTVLGPGSDRLTISGNNASRVFDVTGTNLTIRGLTIANGHGALYGTGIKTAAAGGSVAIIDCVITNNDTTLDGGGIWNAPGVTMTVSNCTIYGNNADGGGGGIYNNNSTATVVACSFIGNTAFLVGGGGIYNEGKSGSATLTINASTFSGNSATILGLGGGIYNDGYGGFAVLEINVSTFSGNSGGGIWNNGHSGTAWLGINASTFSDNGGESILNYGESGSAILQIGDTILNASSVNISNDAGTVISYGYNLLNDDGGGFLTDSTDLVNTDPKLGPLQDNGGPTLTHALLPGSPAIDQGKRLWGLSGTDQRGIPRPSDNPSLANAAGGDGSDIGAFELVPAITVTKLQAKVNFNPAKSSADSCKLTGTVDLEAGFNPSNKVVTVNIGGAQVSFTLDSKGRGITGKSTCKLSFDKKTQLWKLKVSLKKGSWAAPWGARGLENVTTPKGGVTVTMPATVVIGDEGFAADEALSYRATANKSGTAK